MQRSGSTCGLGSMFGRGRNRQIDTWIFFLVNDVRYFSFPFISPPDQWLVGGIYLSQSEPLDSEYQKNHRLGKCCVRFLGSYAVPEWLPWLPTFFQALEASVSTSIIAKINGKSTNPPVLNSKFTYKSWVPQQALLGSGRVKLFISHCAQNSRLEVAFYGVPMLCVPLFGDQILGANLMQWNGFGKLLLKE